MESVEFRVRVLERLAAKSSMAGVHQPSRTLNPGRCVVASSTSVERDTGRSRPDNCRYCHADVLGVEEQIRERSQLVFSMAASERHRLSPFASHAGPCTDFRSACSQVHTVDNSQQTPLFFAVIKNDMALAEAGPR